MSVMKQKGRYENHMSEISRGRRVVKKSWSEKTSGNNVSSYFFKVCLTSTCPKSTEQC